jgi:predicted DNA-binding protein (MmcQ/YjbR family)
MRSGPRVLAKLRKLCLALPDTYEKLSHGEPTFWVNARTFAMFSNAATHHGGSRHGAVIKAAPGRQERAVKSAPDRFFVPPYVGPKGWIGVWLDQNTRWDELVDILRDAHALNTTLRPRRQGRR